MKLNIVCVVGGLGNQMFQYSYYLSLKYSIFPNECNKIFITNYNNHNGFELDYVFNIKKNIIENLIVGFIKKTFKKYIIVVRDLSVGSYKEIEVDNPKNVKYFNGWWQTEKYFINIENEIRSTFQFDYMKVSDKNLLLIEDIKNKNAVSLHIRRGDYVYDQDAKAKFGDICNLEYYSNAINYINQKVKSPFFYIFSDDSEWSKEHFSFLPNSCFIDWNKKRNSWQDMMLMSHCKHNIIANSSFSWWGAWLNSNPNKIVIAPAKWFNIYQASDIVPDNWIKI